MKTKFLIMVLAVLALAGGFAVRATREASQNRTAIDAVASDRAGLLATAASLEQQLRTASAALAKPEPKAGLPPGESGVGDGVGVSAAASASGPAAKPATPTSRPTAQTIIANDPQKLSDYLQGYRADLDLRYGGMFKALGFSAEQAEKWKDVQVGDTLRWMDLSAAMEMQGLDRNSAAYKKLAAENTKIRVTKERKLLGDLWAPYQEYNRAEAVRYLAKELAGTAVYSGLPVTSAQVEQTTQILAANSQRYPSSVGKGSVKTNTVNWPAARAQLQDVLPPVQVEILGRLIQRDATDAKAGEQTRRLTAEFKAKQAAK